MVGFSTRAIRASSRTREVHQHPTSVPIYRTATFAAEAVEESADPVVEMEAATAAAHVADAAAPSEAGPSPA